MSQSSKKGSLRSGQSRGPKTLDATPRCDVLGASRSRGLFRENPGNSNDV